MVDDDISAGSQDEEMTRHHSSSLRGPRPRPSDTPPPSKRLRHPHPPTLPTPWSTTSLREILVLLFVKAVCFLVGLA